MGVPQGCMPSPFPYILFTHDSLAVHPANTVINFAEDTTVNCLRTNDNWLPGALQSNPHQQRGKMMWTLTQEEKTKPGPVFIDDKEVEWVSGFKFLEVHIMDDLSRST